MSVISRKHQVLVPYIYFSIGGQNIAEIPNEHFQGFSYTRETNDVANSFDITVFDETAMEMEGILTKGYDNISFKYGWEGEGDTFKSPLYGGMALDYKMSFESGSAILEINGITNIVKSYVSKRKKVYHKGGRPLKPMKVHEIINDIADYEDWNVGEIEEAKDVIDEENKERIFRQKEESSLKFIKKSLIPIVKSKKTGKGGYVLWFEDESSKPKVNFAPVDYSKEPTKEYVYKLNTERSNVLSFSADYSGTLYMTQGNDTILSRYLESVSNDPTETVRDNSNDGGQIIAEEKKGDTSDSKVMLNKSSSSEKEMIDKQDAYRHKYQAEAYGASLEILGDPSIKVFDTIIVIVVTKGGYIHHSSGLYMIREVRDSLDAGDFRTTLELTRDTSRKGKLEAMGIVAGAKYKGIGV